MVLPVSEDHKAPVSNSMGSVDTSLPVNFCVHKMVPLSLLKKKKSRLSLDNIGKVEYQLYCTEISKVSAMAASGSNFFQRHNYL